MTIHNVPISKVDDADFRSLLSCSETKLSYKTLVNTMLELTLIVEEKIAAEMKGKRGIIMHDGWSKFSRHFVCLLVAYMASTGKQSTNGEEVMEPVMTLLTCTTLPHDDDRNSDFDIDGNGEFIVHRCARTHKMCMRLLDEYSRTNNIFHFVSFRGTCQHCRRH